MCRNVFFFYFVCGVVVWSLFFFQEGCASLLVELILVPDTSNVTLLCVDTLTNYSTLATSAIPSYCTTTGPPFPTLTFGFQLNAIIFPNVTGRGIQNAFPSVLNASLTAHGFFTRSGGAVKMLSEITDQKIAVTTVMSVFTIGFMLISIGLLCCTSYPRRSMGSK
jgi:hypothetical protein